MSTNLFAVGLSWRTAPVAVRERLAFREEEIGEAVVRIAAQPEVAEVMLVSTCNRVEVYGVASSSYQPEQAAAAVRNYLAADRKCDAAAVAAMYAHAGSAAMHHLFHVAAALDSLVVGEAQILGQLKAAFANAQARGVIGTVLGRTFDRAVLAAKRVRTETAIAKGAANVSSVAVELAGRVFGDLEGKSILVVGAGKMSRLAAKHLASAGAKQLVVTNRSIEKAQALAAEIGGIARPWTDLQALVIDADVVISSTGAKDPVLTEKLFKQVAKKRRWRPIMVIDIAVPRDAEPAIADLEGVYLFDIDDLQKVVQSNLSERAKASEHAHKIVQSEATALEQWFAGKQVVPTIKALREHVTKVANDEAARVIEQLQKRPHSPQEQAEIISRLGQVIANKLLHQPTLALRSSRGESAKAHADAIANLFGLTPALEDEISVGEEAQRFGATAASSPPEPHATAQQQQLDAATPLKSTKAVS